MKDLKFMGKQIPTTMYTLHNEKGHVGKHYFKLFAADGVVLYDVTTEMHAGDLLRGGLDPFVAMVESARFRLD